jgi:TrmH family RNA methyltransferase
MSEAAITSLQNPTVKLIRSLSEKKHRQETGLFVAEGDKVLDRARREGWEPDYVVSRQPQPAWGKARMLLADDRVIAGLSGQTNAGPALAVFRQRWARSVTPSGLWLALEELRDPGNLGTIIRTADAVAASGIILAGQGCDPFGPDCVRATMGSIFGMPLLRMTTADLVETCMSWPGETVGTHLSGTLDYRRSYGRPTLLVMGSEGKGLSPDVSAACATLVRIPMVGGAESLNVAIATGLMLYEAIKT